MGFRQRLALLICLSGLLAGLLAGGFYSLLYDLPEINRLKQFKPSSVTRVYDAENRIITRFYLEALGRCQVNFNFDLWFYREVFNFQIDDAVHG